MKYFLNRKGLKAMTKTGSRYILFKELLSHMIQNKDSRGQYKLQMGFLVILSFIFAKVHGRLQITARLYTGKFSFFTGLCNNVIDTPFKSNKSFNLY